MRVIAICVASYMQVFKVAPSVGASSQPRSSSSARDYSVCIAPRQLPTATECTCTSKQKYFFALLVSFGSLSQSMRRHFLRVSIHFDTARLGSLRSADLLLTFSSSARFSPLRPTKRFMVVPAAASRSCSNLGRAVAVLHNDKHERRRPDLIPSSEFFTAPHSFHPPSAAAREITLLFLQILLNLSLTLLANVRRSRLLDKGLASFEICRVHCLTLSTKIFLSHK